MSWKDLRKRAQRRVVWKALDDGLCTVASDGLKKGLSIEIVKRTPQDVVKWPNIVIAAHLFISALAGFHNFGKTWLKIQFMYA